jgi:16S rRNA (cytosine967-C5)-methyltransferase
MSRYYSYINSTKEILTHYKGQEPLSTFLKKYFSSNKKFGARDRREISQLCYCCFRLGKAGKSLTIEERLLTGLFLCSDKPCEILSALKPEWDMKVQLPLQEKLLIINNSLLITEVFPWKNELSDAIDHEKFSESFFAQPDLFIRLRPGSERTVIDKLQNANLEFKMVDESCISFPNSSRLGSIIELDTEAVIQDYSSQRVDQALRSAYSTMRNDKPLVWDCCAGSGGKSIMAYDINSQIDLTVSDVRESILVNLKKRFQKAGIKNYKSFIVDLASGQAKIPNLKSKIIICDAPCTGSGTWSRTPEQLYFFDENEIERFSSLQKKIISNVISRLQSGGSFIYITCSVFRKENEEIVEFMKKNFHLQLKQTEVLKGYDKKADSMFVALLEKL